MKSIRTSTRLLAPSNFRTRSCRMAAGLAVAAVPLASLPTAAGVIRHDVADANYLSLATQHTSVGRVSIANSGFVASGVLIAENWVLTAAHLMDNNNAPTTFRLGASSYGIAERILHPDYNGNLALGNDIALFRLSTAVTDITPATLFSGESEVGGVGTSVGFGMTGNGLTGINFSGGAGTKRAGQNTVDALGSVFGLDADILVYDFDNPAGGSINSLGTADALAMEYLIAFGDSGGGMFQTIGGSNVVTGITSFLASVDGATDGTYSDLGGATRVSSYRPFIEQHVTSAVFIPEPAALAVLVLSGFAMLRRRS